MRNGIRILLFVCFFSPCRVHTQDFKKQVIYQIVTDRFFDVVST